MNGVNKWKVLVYLTALFAAGTVSGWVVSTKTAKHQMFEPPHWDKITARQREQLRTKLNLTPDQAQKVDVILERCSGEMKALFDTHKQRVRQAVQSRNTQIMAVLTSEQRPVFERIERERQEQWRTRSRRGAKDGRHGKSESSTNSEGSCSTNPASAGTLAPATP